MGLRLAVGAGGWISARDGDGPVAYLRCARDPDGRAVLRALLLRADGPITATTLRAIPLGRIEARLNDPHTQLPSSADLDDAMDFRPPVDEPEIDTQVLVGRQLSETGSAADDLVVQPARRLSRPGVGGGHGDDFYQQVAQRYQDAMRETARPAVVLANEASVPITTVHRWIREARRRGFLPPGRKGKAG